MEKIRVKIPWWYKPFIKFMPDFYKDVPKYKEGRFIAGRFILPFSFVGTRYDKYSKKIYTDNHSAYLKARWMAFITDAFDSTDRGIAWVIIEK